MSQPLLDRYWVQEVIAHGGMSVVYRGLDQRLLRPVCIKVFDGLEASSQPAYATGHDHFVQEAFALSRLAHPNTMRIYDFGFLERKPPLPFQISEWVGGGTLHQRIKRDGPLDATGAAELVEPILGALAEAHAAGIVHRDVKPSNILLVDGPRLMPKLADFGIAKAAARALPHGAETQAIDFGRILLYSPGWSAPEQLRGEPVTPATDVFAVGLMIAFILHGRSILSASTLTRIVEEQGDLDAALLHALGETAIPPALATVIARACRARVADRLPDADALRAELVAAVEPVPEPVAGPEETLPEPFVPMVGNERSITHDTMTNTATLEQSTATFLAGGRVVRVVETAEQVELSHGSAKLRVSLIASPDGDVHLHVKGINCFVSRVEGRPTGAVALQKDETVQLLSPERRLLGSMKCGFGSPARPGRLFRLGQSSVRVPQPAVLIDFDVSQEVLLIQQARGA